MLYNVSQPRLPTPLDAQYRVMSGDEVTFIAWKAQGKSMSYGLRWRDICDKAGILDPMQVASVRGQRDIIGNELSLGMPLDL